MNEENENINIVTQYEYEKIEILNQKAQDIVQDFIDILDEFFIDVCNEYGFIINIGKIYNFKNALDLQSRNCSEKIKIVIKLGKEKEIQKEGQTVKVKCYFDDVYKVIKTPVTQQILLLKKYTKKIVKLIRQPNVKKEFQKIRAKIRKKLNNLEKEQINIQNNLKNELA